MGGLVIEASWRWGLVGARGVGLLERLITHGDSPLYGREAAVLREELRRVRSALGE